MLSPSPELIVNVEDRAFSGLSAYQVDIEQSPAFTLFPPFIWYYWEVVRGLFSLLCRGASGVCPMGHEGLPRLIIG